MYRELIKWLWECASGECFNCSHKGNASCPDDLMKQAADAIEDLQKQLHKSEEDNVNLTGWLAEEHAKAEDFENKLNLWRHDKISRWIPVTEQLPKENGFYLCLYKHKASGGVAMDEGLSILQWINNKWGINDIYLVTYWTPLPQPPEVET